MAVDIPLTGLKFCLEDVSDYFGRSIGGQITKIGVLKFSGGHFEGSPNYFLITLDGTFLSLDQNTNSHS